MIEIIFDMVQKSYLFKLVILQLNMYDTKLEEREKKSLSSLDENISMICITLE